MATKIFVVDDHEIFRQALGVLISQQNEIKLVGQTGNPLKSIQLIEETAPDVVIMDLLMTGLNGIELTRQLRSVYCNIEVLCLSMCCEPQYVREIVDAGASGYVLKSAAFSELADAIQAVYSGRTYFSQVIRSFLLPDDRTISKKRKDNGLTTREQSILCLIAEGNTNQEISDILGLSVYTVIRHRQNIMDKTGLHTTAELTRLAVYRNMMPL
jgi:two-component system, NarL family, response regulator NreC